LRECRPDERQTDESDYSADKLRPSPFSPSKFHGSRRKSRLANPLRLAAHVLTFFSSESLGETSDLKNETKPGGIGVLSRIQMYFTNERLISF